MTRHSIVAHFDQDDYLSLLEKSPDLSGLFHEIGQMIIRGEIPVPKFTPTFVEPRGETKTVFTQRRLNKMYDSAYDIVRRGDGEWVPWQNIRPAFRDRETYSDRLWQLFVEDPDMETRAIQHGARVRRAVRFAPLV